MTDWSKYPINHLCSKCNKEYPLPVEVNNAGATSVFANCPHCGNREQLWIRIPWYTDVIRAYEESLTSDNFQTKMAEQKCENCNNYTKNGVCKLDGYGKSPLEDCGDFSAIKHKKRLP